MLDYSWKLLKRKGSRSPISRDNRRRRSPSPSWRSGRSNRPRSPLRKDRGNPSVDLRDDRFEHGRSPLRRDRESPTKTLRDDRMGHPISPYRGDRRLPSPTWRDERSEHNQRSPSRKDGRFPSPTWRDERSEHNQRSPSRKDGRFPSPTWRDGMLQRQRSPSPVRRNERMPSPSSDLRRDDIHVRRGAVLRSDKEEEQRGMTRNMYGQNNRDVVPGRRGAIFRSDRIEDREEISRERYWDQRNKDDNIPMRRDVVLRSDGIRDQEDISRDFDRDPRDMIDDIVGRRGTFLRSERVDEQEDTAKDIYRDSMDRIDNIAGRRVSILISDANEPNILRNMYGDARGPIDDISGRRGANLISSRDLKDTSRNVEEAPRGRNNDIRGRTGAILRSDRDEDQEDGRIMLEDPRDRIDDIHGRTGDILRSSRDEVTYELENARDRKKARPNAKKRRAMRLRGQENNGKNLNNEFTDTSQSRRRSSGETDLRLVIEEAHKRKNKNFREPRDEKIITTSDIRHSDNMSRRNAREFLEQDFKLDHEKSRKYDEGRHDEFIREISVSKKRSVDRLVPDLQISNQDERDAFKNRESDGYLMDHREKDHISFQNKREEFRADFRYLDLDDGRFTDPRFDSPLRENREFDDFLGDKRGHVDDGRFSNLRFDSPLRENREFDDLMKRGRIESGLRSVHGDNWHQRSKRFDPYFETDPIRDPRRNSYVDFEGPLPFDVIHRDHRDRDESELQECKIAGCLVRTDNLKLHTLRKHIPEVVWSVEESAHQSQRDLAPQRVSLLKAQAMAVLGPQGTITQLVDLVNGIGIPVPDGEELTACHWAMVEVCHYENWTIPDSFSLNPINSPAVLIHWRVQAILMGLLPEERARNFLSVYRIVDPSKSSVARSILDAVPRIPDHR